MLAASWANGLLPVTVNIRGSSSVETGYIQGSWNKVMNPEFTGGLTSMQTQGIITEAGQRWRIFRRIKNPGLTPRGKLSHLWKLMH